jgi:DNA mismatch repair protein MutL
LQPRPPLARTNQTNAASTASPFKMDTVATPGTPATEHQRNQLEFVRGFGMSTRPATPGDPSQSAPPTAQPTDRPREPYAEPAAREEATLIGRLKQTPHPPRVLAQIALTYILADAGGEGVLVIDQHAAHEKILYLDYMRQAAAKSGVVVQPLLLPHSIEVAATETAAMEALRPALARAGFEVEPFGGRTFMVQAIPAALERLDVPAFLRDLLDDFGEGDLVRELDRLTHRIGARAACRAAVKSGDRLTSEEMQRLLDQLLTTEDALRCPHGRPTTLLMTREQLDRQFGRLG